MDDTRFRITAATNICFQGIDFAPLMLASIGVVRGSLFRRDHNTMWDDNIDEAVLWITQ
jgi:hypothetical protein